MHLYIESSANSPANSTRRQCFEPTYVQVYAVLDLKASVITSRDKSNPFMQINGHYPIAFLEDPNLNPSLGPQYQLMQDSLSPGMSIPSPDFKHIITNSGTPTLRLLSLTRASLANRFHFQFNIPTFDSNTPLVQLRPRYYISNTRPEVLVCLPTRGEFRLYPHFYQLVMIGILHGYVLRNTNSTSSRKPTHCIQLLHGSQLLPATILQDALADETYFKPDFPSLFLHQYEAGTIPSCKQTYHSSACVQGLQAVKVIYRISSKS
ncbi:hypothetical protein C8R44DRAFT_747398 [Mycena epipterygia]|nr:hypothetical protein C8R44DRAFT_747398 [Mycena epipterygia]